MHSGDQTSADGGVRWKEAERSAALHAYNLLDTPRERDFDDLAQMAAQVCETPIAVVNLVDTNRQFFKAEVGLGVRETPLETSFCGKAILAEDMMIVPDATKDPRFDCNPLVTGDPKLRFYAGALLKSPAGLPIGTICVLDYRPRELDQRQIDMLSFLARQAMAQIELRHLLIVQQRVLQRSQAAEREKAMLARVVEQSSDFVGMADLHGTVFFLNDAARRMVGMAESDVTERKIVDFFIESDRQAVLETVMPAVDRDGFWEGELNFRHFETAAAIPVLYSIFPLREESGELAGYGTVTRDITERKIAEGRKADITREISHRMKNTLAMVQAIVTQTFRQAKTMQEGREAIAGRLTALARAQDILTAIDGSGGAIRDVVATALAPHQMGHGRFAVSGPAIEISSAQSIGLSLAVHELATNAAKYGALSNADGRVAIGWSVAEGGRFQFLWTESGGPAVTMPTRTGFGSRLVERIVAPYFNGQADLKFEPAGVQFILEGEIMSADHTSRSAP